MNIKNIPLEDFIEAFIIGLQNLFLIIIIIIIIHNGQRQQFSMAVTKTFRYDSMMRQISEAVQINNTEPRELMNTRAEWNLNRIPRAAIHAE